MDEDGHEADSNGTSRIALANPSPEGSVSCTFKIRFSPAFKTLANAKPVAQEEYKESQAEGSLS